MPRGVELYCGSTTGVGWGPTSATVRAMAAANVTVPTVPPPVDDTTPATGAMATVDWSTVWTCYPVQCPLLTGLLQSTPGASLTLAVPTSSSIPVAVSDGGDSPAPDLAYDLVVRTYTAPMVPHTTGYSIGTLGLASCPTGFVPGYDPAVLGELMDIPTEKLTKAALQADPNVAASVYSARAWLEESTLPVFSTANAADTTAGFSFSSLGPDTRARLSALRLRGAVNAAAAADASMLSVLECLPTGAWSVPVASAIRCVPASCSSLDSLLPAWGIKPVYTQSPGAFDPSSADERYAVGTVAELGCEEGYTPLLPPRGVRAARTEFPAFPDANKTTVSRVCGSDGRWSGSQVVCVGKLRAMRLDFDPYLLTARATFSHPTTMPAASVPPINMAWSSAPAFMPDSAFSDFAQQPAGEVPRTSSEFEPLPTSDSSNSTGTNSTDSDTTSGKARSLDNDDDNDTSDPIDDEEPVENDSDDDGTGVNSPSNSEVDGDTNEELSAQSEPKTAFITAEAKVTAPRKTAARAGTATPRGRGIAQRIGGATKRANSRARARAMAYTIVEGSTFEPSSVAAVSSYATCQALIAPASLAAIGGTDAKCYWSSAYTLTIALGVNHKLSPASLIGSSVVEPGAVATIALQADRIPMDTRRLPLDLMRGCPAAAAAFALGYPWPVELVQSVCSTQAETPSFAAVAQEPPALAADAWLRDARLTASEVEPLSANPRVDFIPPACLIIPRVAVALTSESDFNDDGDDTGDGEDGSWTGFPALGPLILVIPDAPTSLPRLADTQMPELVMDNAPLSSPGVGLLPEHSRDLSRWSPVRARLTFPTMSGYGTPIAIAGGLSRGGAGRLLQYNFELVAQSGDPTGVLTAAFAEYASIYTPTRIGVPFTTTSSPAPLPSLYIDADSADALFPPGMTHQVRLVIINWLGQSSSCTMPLVRLARIAPQISIISQSLPLRDAEYAAAGLGGRATLASISSTAADPSVFAPAGAPMSTNLDAVLLDTSTGMRYLHALADTPLVLMAMSRFSLNATAQTHALSHRWNVDIGPTVEVLRDGSAIAMARMLLLPPRSLQPGSTYTFSATVTQTPLTSDAQPSSSLSSTETITVRVLPGTIHPRITVVTPTTPLLFVPAPSGIRLSAHATYLDGTLNSTMRPFAVEYRWNCTVRRRLGVNARISPADALQRAQWSPMYDWGGGASPLGPS